VYCLPVLAQEVRANSRALVHMTLLVDPLLVMLCVREKEREREH